MKLIIIFLFSFVASCEKDHSQNSKESQLGLLWSYYTENSSAPRPNPLLEDNFIYVTGGLGLHKVSSLDGKRAYFSLVEGTASSLMNYRFIDNTNTIIGLMPKTILGFNKLNGDLKWSTIIPDSINLFIIGMGAKYQNVAYYTSSTTGYLIAIDIDSGQIHWLHQFPFKIRNINVFENGDLLIPYEEELSQEPPYPFRAVMGRWRPSTKEWIWEHELNGGGNFSIRYPQIDQSIIYSGLLGGGFIAINADTGDEVWKVTDINLVSGFHVITPDTIFVSAISFLYALDRHTGREIWRTEEIGTSERTLLHYKNGYVYWGHANGIYIFDAKDGKQVHYQSPEHGGYIWTSAMGPDRYFVQTGTHLLAYELYNPED